MFRMDQDMKWYTVTMLRGDKFAKVVWVAARGKDDAKSRAEVACNGYRSARFNGAVVRQDCEPLVSDVVVN